MHEFEEQYGATASDVAFQRATDRLYEYANEEDWSVADRVLLQAFVAADETIEEFFPNDYPDQKQFDKRLLVHDILKRFQQNGELSEDDDIALWWSTQTNFWLEYTDSQGNVFTMSFKSSPGSIYAFEGDELEEYENLRSTATRYEPDATVLRRVNQEREPRRFTPRKQVADWGRTALAVGHLAHTDRRYEGAYDEEYPYGRFAGRHVIGRDTSINGGVYVGLPNGNREAIVVDDVKHPDALNRAYAEAIQSVYRAARWEGWFSDPSRSAVETNILRPVFETVRSMMPYSNDVVASIVNKHQKDTKVALNSFINRGGGVCRHQALLVGYILERMQSSGELSEEDRISVDRNGEKGGGGHVWVRYKSSDGTVYIIDPAQDFVGTLEEADALERTWSYARPEDYV
jgi:hypothetical protein